MANFIKIDSSYYNLDYLIELTDITPSIYDQDRLYFAMYFNLGSDTRPLVKVERDVKDRAELYNLHTQILKQIGVNS